MSMAIYDPFYIKIWKICLPHIIITSPRADVCARCEPNKRALEDAVTDQARMDAVKDHIKKTVRCTQRVSTQYTKILLYRTQTSIFTLKRSSFNQETRNMTY